MRLFITTLFLAMALATNSTLLSSTSTSEVTCGTLEAVTVIAMTILNALSVYLTKKWKEADSG